MPDYDFKVLSPIDFETLARDLLQEEFRIRIESFKPGPDKGIDLRFAQNKRKDWIVQCKHYAGSTFSALLRDLQKEVVKVGSLSPTRYFLVTSLGLSPENKRKIGDIFRPFVVGPSDILGREDLNNLLARHKKIERQTFKLWFASVNVFEEILSRQVKNVSRDALEAIREKAKYFVQNPSFAVALKILKKSNFCVIAGIPGIGKTTLAEMLVLHFIELGYDFIKIESDISEARGIDYVTQKRIFYYDDFLGQASVSEKLNKNEDQKLLDFLAAVKRSNVSKMILTTREYILNQTKLRYEKLDRSNFDVETCVVDLQEYTRLIRAQILFNHLFFSKLPSVYIKALLRNGRYLEIIDHDNYSPRIIQLMTEPSWVAGRRPGGYVNAFLENLENPLQIWRHAFEHQLSEGAKVLLCQMVTLPREAYLEDMRLAFANAFAYYTSTFNIVSRSNEFERVVKELDGNFVATDRDNNGRGTISFHNPSIRDFLQNHLLAHGDDVFAILKTATFFEQLSWLWNFEGGLQQSQSFRDFIQKECDTFVESLGRTVEAPSFMQRYRLVADEWRFDSATLEERVETLVRIAKVVGDPRIEQLIVTELKRVCLRIQHSRAHKGDVARLLGVVGKAKFIPKDFRKHILSVAAPFFLQFSSNLRDFEAYRDFIKSNPTAIRKRDRVRAGLQFQRVADRDTDEEDADTIREYASKIEDLATTFGIDMSSKLESLEELASKNENEARERTKERKEVKRPQIEIEGECSDRDIESMFRALR